MKTKIIFTSLIVLAIAVVGIVVFFISRPQPEELLPQKFAELPEKPKLIAEYNHGATSKSDMSHSYVVPPMLNQVIFSVAISPVDTSLVASVNGAGTIKLWNTDNTKEPVKTLNHPGIYPSVGFSPTGELLISADHGKKVLWDVVTGTKINSIESYSKEFTFSPNGQQLATIHDKKEKHDTEVKIWDIRDPKKIREIDTLPFDEAHKTKGWAGAVAISPDGRWIAAGYSNGTIDVWDLKTKQLLKTLETYIYNMDYIKFSPNKKYMVAGGHDQDLYSTSNAKGFIMWELPSWRRKGEVLRGPVENLVFSPDENMCVSTNDFALEGRGIEIWSTANGAPIGSIQTEAKDVSFSKDGNFLITGSRDGVVHLWQLTQSQLDFTKVRNNFVRLIYYLPEAGEPSPDITQKLDKTIRKVQGIYADEMERHGFGRKTFRFETDQNGKAKIYFMDQKQIDYHDLQLNDIWLVFVDDKEHFNSVFFYNSTRIGLRNYLYDETFPIPTRMDKNWKREIKGFAGKGRFVYGTKKGFEWRLTAYELKHLFAGLGQEHRLNKFEPNMFKRFFSGINRKLPWHKDRVKLSKCEAEWLDKCRFFNPDQSFFDKPTKITLNVFPIDTTKSRNLQFDVSDEDGVHQVQLFSPIDPILKHYKNNLQGCRLLKGKKNASVEFEITNPDVKEVELRMIDMLGNTASREFRIIKKESEPSKDP